MIGVPTVKEEISIACQIPTYKEDAPPKIIVEFTRRNRFYHNGSLRKLANEKIQDLPYLNLTSTENLYISESLTPYKKQLFSKVNKQKKELKWKYIWTQSGIIFIKANKNSTMTHSFDTLTLQNFKMNFNILLPRFFRPQLFHLRGKRHHSLEKQRNIVFKFSIEVFFIRYLHDSIIEWRILISTV